MATTSEIETAKSQVADQTSTMAYLAAVNVTHLMLLDLATLQRNNYMIYTSSLALAMKKLADGDAHGTYCIEALEKSMQVDQAYIEKTGSIYVQLLSEFKKLQYS